MAKANPFRFSTKYQDDETDLIYYGYRYLNTSTARWTSRDPVGEDGGESLYSPCSNDMLNRTDYLGQYEADFHFYVVYYLLRAKCFTRDAPYQIAHFSQNVDDDPLTDPYGLGVRVASGDQAAAQLLARFHFINSTPTRATTASRADALKSPANH